MAKPKYRKKGQIDVYEKVPEKGGCGSTIVGLIVVIVFIAICAGIFGSNN